MSRQHLMRFAPPGPTLHGGSRFAWIAALLLTLVSTLLIGVLAPASHAQEPTLSTVLERAGAYVARYQRQLAGVMAEEGDDLPARGRLWLEPETGRLRMTELIAEDRNIYGVVSVSYETEPPSACSCQLRCGRATPVARPAWKAPPSTVASANSTSWGETLSRDP